MADDAADNGLPAELTQRVEWAQARFRKEMAVRFPEPEWTPQRLREGGMNC